MDSDGESVEVDLRPGLAALKCWATGDAAGWAAVLGDDQAPLVAAGLAEVALLFIRDLSSSPAEHVDLMFRALEAAEREGVRSDVH